MTIIGPRRKYVPEADVYTHGRYNLEPHGHRNRKVWRKNRRTRRWLKRVAYRYRGWPAIDPTAPVTWSASQYTYTPA